MRRNYRGRIEINNPLQMNDWEIGKFLKVILAIQLMMWGAIGLGAIGFQIPLMRQFIGFIYLSFVPGIVILRILKLHKIGNIETILYTVGLSIATLMFTGLFMNVFYQIFGISKQISITPLIITISILLLILCILGYIRDKDYSNPSFIEIQDILSPPALFLCLIPIIAIFGTHIVNFYHSDILLLFLIPIIALIVLLITFDEFIPKKLYPFAVIMISVSLLYHSSLISQYLIGGDIQIEYYFSNLVLQNSHWDSTINSNVNGMLSIVMLSPIYSIICEMSLTWIFKIIYPFLYSLVPITLYQIYRKQTNDKISFLSCFFFVSFFSFYGEMLALARQQIAELFFVLLILIMIDKKMVKIKKSVLSIIFVFSLAVSHYGLTYIYLFIIITSILILFLTHHQSVRKMMSCIFSKVWKNTNKGYTSNSLPSKPKYETFSLYFLLTILVFIITWYMSVSSQSSFNSIVRIGDQISHTISIDLLNPGTREENVLMAVGGGNLKHISLQRQFHLILQYVVEFFIIIGVLNIKNKDVKFDVNYIAMTYASVLILLASIIVPHFSANLNMTRIYAIVLIILAPFCIVGGLIIFRAIHKQFKYVLFHYPHYTTDKTLYLKLLVILILVPYFMVNIQFIYVTTGDVSTIWSGLTHNEYLFMTTTERDIVASDWLLSNTANSTHVYSGHYPNLFLWTHNLFPLERLRYIKIFDTNQPDNSYIYLYYGSIVNDKLTTRDPTSNKLVSTSFLSRTFLNQSNKIYDDGAEVYAS